VAGVNEILSKIAKSCEVKHSVISGQHSAALIVPGSRFAVLSFDVGEGSRVKKLNG
jgi:hypothetical protein